MKTLRITVLPYLVLLFSLNCYTQNINIDINVNIEHITGGISQFDRAKFVTMHSSNYELDWEGLAKEKEYLIDGLDVYFGRETGRLAEAYYYANEDINRPGYADIEYMKLTSADTVKVYAARKEWHRYEDRQELIIASQDRLFPSKHHKNKSGWGFSLTDTEEEPFGTAMGEFIGYYLKYYFGMGGITGQPKPKYLEVMNEPIWPLVEFGDETIDDIFKLHTVVAREVKKISPETMVGGYTTAFPDFDRRNFAQWDERWKRFIDECGDDMDFYSIHLYDFPGINGGVEQYRKGSNIEATFDMLSHYSMLTSGKIKPYLISEYGSQLHDWYNQPWSQYRDWLMLKSWSSMLMQFMERPDRIIKTIPFSILKAEWGYGNFTNNGVPYYWRLMRKANEPRDYSGNWIWTEVIHFYELWSDVKGKRVDTKSSDPDIQVDAYVDDEHLYLILNSLETTRVKLNLNTYGLEENMISSVTAKHLYYNDEVKYVTDSLEKAPSEVELEADATMILDYTIKRQINIDHASNESKYYADKHMQPIKAAISSKFNINGLELVSCGEAVLRLSIGRELGLSIKPEVRMNNVLLEVPDDIRGDVQKERWAFFGTLEIPVPYDILLKSNTVSVMFTDQGGYISSMALQVFNMSKKAKRSADTSVEEIALSQEEYLVMETKHLQLPCNIQPVNASNKVIRWKSDNPQVARVDPFTGNVLGISKGKTTITAESADGGYTASCKVLVKKYSPISVSSVNLSNNEIKLLESETQLLVAEVQPTNADNIGIAWNSTDTTVATVNNVGFVLAIQPGETSIIVQTADGSFTDTCHIKVNKLVKQTVDFIGAERYINTEYKAGQNMEVACKYVSGSKNLANKITLRLREVTEDWSLVKDINIEDASINGTVEGTINLSIPLEGVVPSDELPSGNFYFLYAQFKLQSGTIVDKGLFPIKIAASDED